MADDNILQQEVSQPDASAQLAQHMALALGTAPPPETPATPNPEVPTEPQAPADTFDLFKEKFGWEAPETAIKEIEELRAFKAAPPVAEYKFENPESEKALKALQAGNLKEVYEILDQQLKIDNLTNGEITDKNAADLVKLQMSLKYKDLTQKEIDYKFNKQYGLPPKPVQSADEDTDDYEARVASWQAIVDDKTTELLIDAKLAKPDIQAAKSKLVFPEIAQQQDPDYLEWKKSRDDIGTAQVQTTEAYKAFTPKTIKTTLDFLDEPNKIKFTFDYEPSTEDFSKTMQMTSDFGEFWNHFTKPDGSPDREGFAKAIHFALNSSKIITEAMKQAKNATIKSMLPDNSQAGGLVRQLVTTPETPDELAQEMERRGIRRQA